jgi:transposase-like protein
MSLCPCCHKQTTIPCGAEFQSIDIGRYTCDHCGREFLVIDDDVPVIEDQLGKKKAPKGTR